MSTNDDPIAGLLARLGLEGAEPDEDGIITLFVDQHLPVMMGSDGQRVYLYAGVGEVAEDRRAEVSRLLLEGNQKMFEQDGFALAIAPETDLVFLLARERLGALSEDDLFRLFDRFVDAADAWHENLRAAPPEDEGRTSRPEEPEWPGGRPPFPGELV
jgi:Tir chaperone protein (CesT) family